MVQMPTIWRKLFIAIEKQLQSNEVANKGRVGLAVVLKGNNLLKIFVDDCQSPLHCFEAVSFIYTPTAMPVPSTRDGEKISSSTSAVAAGGPVSEEDLCDESLDNPNPTPC